MDMQAHLRKSATIVIIAAITPSSLMAGGYGAAGVKDATVSQHAAADGTVWCPRLNEKIPAGLGERMDCGTGAPAVADERQRGLRGFFANLRHVPQKKPDLSGDDSDSNRRTRVSSEPEDRTAGSVSKWERLGELNVTPGNLISQSPEFHEQLREYRSSKGSEDDWSDFDPD